MSESVKRIVVAGDAAIDWFLYPVPAEDEGENWRCHPSRHAAVQPGGAFLLARFIEQAVAHDGVAAEVFAPQPPGELRVVPPEQVVHSNAMLEFCLLDSNTKDRTLRVKSSLGYIGPLGGSTTPLLMEFDHDDADIIVIDDSANGFRQDSGNWPAVIASSHESLMIHKLSQPILRSPLWNAISEQSARRHLVVVNAKDLRSVDGVEISRSLSWERTAKDLVFQMRHCENLELFSTCAFVVVLFGMDGAILYRVADPASATLVFDPSRLEGGFAAGVEGDMYGQTSAFTAALVSGIAKNGLGALEHAAKRGLRATRDLLRLGFRQDVQGISYADVFASVILGDSFESAEIEMPTSLEVADPESWRILDQRTRNVRSLLAEDLVRFGKSKHLRGIPLGSFGKLQTIDRTEIESYSAIRELISEYLNDPDPNRPLSFAVFGPPGSGKSFGVKQVLASIGRPDLQIRTFNISQFQSYDDLVGAFHEIRDIALSGNVPFVFFDEFDAACGGAPIGWLKFFLAPMQDAEFKDGRGTHPVGNAIFAFAGGTSASFGAFVNQSEEVDAGSSPRSAAELPAPGTSQSSPGGRFGDAKGPDFVSRLRGFIDVMGPNPQSLQDEAFVIRRAILLRSMFERAARTKMLFDSDGMLQIDDGALRALLHISRYRHGARSMEAILGMSRLEGKRRFDLSALPASRQLDLHVDAEEFLFLSKQERFCTLVAPPVQLSAIEQRAGD